MKILVTGGRGLIGRWVVDELVRAGHTVVSVVRTGSPPVVGSLRAAQHEILGDASDADLMSNLCTDVECVVHLAAIPAPVGYTARELVVRNSVTTMTVLEAAGEAGVRGVVMASSISVLGMAWSAATMPPLSLPIDEEHPLRPTEGYALSKEFDEASARMAARRWNLPIVALRFPFTQTREAIAIRASDPAQAERLAKELWAYLDLRDAARAVRLAVETATSDALPGATILSIMADDVCSPEPIAALIDRWYPSMRGVLPPEARCAYDTSAAVRAIGFQAEHRLNYG